MRTLLLVALLLSPLGTARAQEPQRPAISADPEETAMRTVVAGVARGDAAALRHARHVVRRRVGTHGGQAVRNPRAALAWLAPLPYVEHGASPPADGNASWWSCSVTDSTCTVSQPGGETVLELRRAHGAWELAAIVWDDP